MKSIHHGLLYYAVDSRDVGTFGGKAKASTIKIYDTRDCGSPRMTISGEYARKMRDRLAGMYERGERDTYFRAVIETAANI